MASKQNLPALALRRRFLRRYQRETAFEISRALEMVRGETFTVMFPRQAGKNEVSASLVAYLLLANASRGGTIVLCARHASAWTGRWSTWRCSRTRRFPSA